MSEISIVEVKPQIVLGMRKHGKYEEIATMLQMIFQFAAMRGIQIQGPPFFVCHEQSKEEVERAEKEGNADVEVAVPIQGKAEGTDGIRCYEMAGSRMARIAHRGPYQDCEPAYDELFGWIIEKGMKVTGPTREVYMNDPSEVEQEDVLTEIYAPIE